MSLLVENIENNRAEINNIGSAEAQATRVLKVSPGNQQNIWVELSAHHNELCTEFAHKEICRTKIHKLEATFLLFYKLFF